MQYRKSGYLGSLRNMHLALLAGQCVMLGIALYLVVQKKIPPAEKSLDKILQIAALAVAFVGVYGATVMIKKKLGAINTSGSKLEEKAGQYRMASRIQWVLLECASFFSIACFLLTGNYAFGALAVALILFFALQAPTRLKIMLQLQLNEQEADSLQ